MLSGIVILFILGCFHNFANARRTYQYIRQVLTLPYDAPDISPEENANFAQDALVTSLMSSALGALTDTKNGFYM